MTGTVKILLYIFSIIIFITILIKFDAVYMYLSAQLLTTGGIALLNNHD